jgi:hypothetical protein
MDRNTTGLLYVLFIVFSAMFVTVPTITFYYGELKNIEALLFISNTAWIILLVICYVKLNKYLKGDE